MVVNADKKLGPVLIERKKYIRLAFHNHLNNNTSYLQLDHESFEHVKKRTCEIFKGILAQAISTRQLPKNEIV